MDWPPCGSGCATGRIVAIPASSRRSPPSWNGLGESARSAKVDALIALVRRSDEKKIVFTRFRATLDELHGALCAAGHRVSIFHGGLPTADKEAAVAAFEADSEILLSSEVGGEGRNLQFCRTVINYDLPWNPVTIEQRVGRVHRIGQTRDVFVFNLCLAGSVEERILAILHDKINLFELVAGEIRNDPWTPRRRPGLCGSGDGRLVEKPFA